MNGRIYEEVNTFSVDTIYLWLKQNGTWVKLHEHAFCSPILYTFKVQFQCSLMWPPFSLCAQQPKVDCMRSTRGNTKNTRSIRRSITVTTPAVATPSPSPWRNTPTPTTPCPCPDPHRHHSYGSRSNWGARHWALRGNDEPLYDAHKGHPQHLYRKSFYKNIIHLLMLSVFPDCNISSATFE